MILDALKVKGYPAPIEVTGWLYLVSTHDEFGNPVGMRTEWVGGKVISMSYGLLEMAPRELVQRDGDKVTVLDQELRIIADCPELATVYLERQD